MVKRKGLTREYFGVVGDVYREKGLLAAIAYDIKSTFVSLGTKLANLVDIPKTPSYTGSDIGREIGAGGWSRGSVGERDYRDAEERRAARQREKREYLLRHKRQQEGGLAGRVGVFIVSIIAGIALSLTSLQATGSAIGTLGTTQGLLGIFLFILGLAGIFFSLKK